MKTMTPAQAEHQLTQWLTALTNGVRRGPHALNLFPNTCGSKPSP